MDINKEIANAEKEMDKFSKQHKIKEYMVAKTRYSILCKKRDAMGGGGNIVETYKYPRIEGVSV